MKGLLFKWLALAVAVMAAAYVIEGIYISGFVTALFAALTLGILNALFRPILLILTLPINVLTLGLFTFVINAVLLLMTSGLVGGLVVTNFASALLGSLIISSVSWLLSMFVNNQGRIESMDIELRRRRDGRWE